MRRIAEKLGRGFRLRNDNMVNGVDVDVDVVSGDLAGPVD